MLAMSERVAPNGDTSPLLPGERIEVLCGTDKPHYRLATVHRCYYAPGNARFGRVWAVECTIDGYEGFPVDVIYVDYNGSGYARPGWPVIRPVVQD